MKIYNLNWAFRHNLYSNFFWLGISQKNKDCANIKMTLQMITVDCRCSAIYDEELFKVGPLYFGCTFPGNLSFA